MSTLSNRSNRPPANTVNPSPQNFSRLRGRPPLPPPAPALDREMSVNLDLLSGTGAWRRRGQGPPRDLGRFIGGQAEEPEHAFGVVGVGVLWGLPVEYGSHHGEECVIRSATT
jgi:hypothetical protein